MKNIIYIPQSELQRALQRKDSGFLLWVSLLRYGTIHEWRIVDLVRLLGWSEGYVRKSLGSAIRSGYVEVYGRGLVCRNPGRYYGVRRDRDGLVDREGWVKICFRSGVCYGVQESWWYLRGYYLRHRLRQQQYVIGKRLSDKNCRREGATKSGDSRYGLRKGYRSIGKEIGVSISGVRRTLEFMCSRGLIGGFMSREYCVVVDYGTTERKLRRRGTTTYIL